MKKRTLTLVISLLLVALVAVGGTLAYLMDKSGPVTNTFTAGDVDIELAETTGSDYAMVPGNTISKDPKVTVSADSEDCYLYVKVEKANAFDNYISYTMADGWIQLKDANDADVVGVFYREAKANDSFSVLADDQVTVKPEVTKAMMDAIDEESEAKPQIKFTAYAIQKANVADAAAGWTELNK